MNDKEFLRFLRDKPTDELLEILEFRETLAQLYSDISTGTAPALVAKNERICALIKSELARRGAFDEPDVIARLTAHSVKLWRPFTEDDREWFRELKDELAEDSSD
jgi:hypothetical protein